MNDMGYKPNSNRSKEEAKVVPSEKGRVEKVVNGKVKTKKNEVRKFTDIFLAEDIANVKNYIINDVIIPSIKKAIVDTIIDSTTMIFGTGSRNANSSSPKVSYQKCYNQPQDRPYVPTASAPRTRFEYDDLIFETRADAEDMLAEMRSVIGRYGFVTVADMYDIAQLSQPFTSNKYGWYNINSAEIIRVRDGGWTIKLPKAGPI